MIHKYSIELVRKNKNNVPMYFLLSREFTWHKAEKRFKELVRMYPNERIELSSNHWVNTHLGYMPMAWSNSTIKE